MKCKGCSSELGAADRRCSYCGLPVPLNAAFAHAEEAYHRLRDQYEARTLSADQFKSAVEAQMINHDGRYWMLGVNSGKWYAYDGANWTEAEPPLLAEAQKVEPPAHSPKPTVAATSAGHDNSRPSPAVSPTQKSKGISEWEIALIALLIAGLSYLYIATHN